MACGVQCTGYLERGTGVSSGGRGAGEAASPWRRAGVARAPSSACCGPKAAGDGCNGALCTGGTSAVLCAGGGGALC